MREILSQAIRAQVGQGRLAVIAEVKCKRDGNVDLLRGRSAAEIASVYRECGAAALSVVTSPFFGGSLRLLEEVAGVAAGLPVLRKDLIDGERSIEVSKRLGASAVLFVLPLMGIERLLTMVNVARQHELEPFVEIATRQELDSLREFYDGIIAINNADIVTGELAGADISRSIDLIDHTDPRLWVSASRITGATDVRKLKAAGFSGILIGTHLLLSDDLRAQTTQVISSARE